jgi:dienelactone hydrolase
MMWNKERWTEKQAIRTREMVSIYEELVENKFAWQGLFGQNVEFDMEHVYLAGFDYGACTAWNTAKELGKEKIKGLLLLDGLFLTISNDEDFESDIPMLSVNSEKES